MTTIPEQEHRCQKGAGSFWAGIQCTRRATGDDRLCTQHRTAKAERAAKDQAWNLRLQQNKFVRCWREAHAGDMYGVSWTCPLCCKVIQAQESTAAHSAMVTVLAEKHQRAHGQDWLDYEAAGRVLQGRG